MKTILTLSLANLLVLNSCTSEQTITEPEIENHYAEAQTLFDAGSYDEALSALHRALEVDSTPIEYHELLGEILWEIGDTAQSNEQFDFVLSAMQNDSAEIEEIESLISWELQHHNKEEADKLLTKDLEYYKDDHASQCKIIAYTFQKYQQFGHDGEALDFLEATFKKYPSNTRIHKLKADYYFVKKEYREARHSYIIYVDNHAKDTDALFHLGVCYLQAKNKSKAKKYFEQAKELGHAEACMNYRELSAKTRYYVQSRCCDGTTSSSTGRGTCSHHGGVCRTEHVPYKEYITNCN